jgi:hypothetical protein
MPNPMALIQPIRKRLPPACRITAGRLYPMQDFRNVPIISHLKKRILVQDRGGSAGILKYVEGLKQRPNKEIGPKGFFEIAYSNKSEFS